MNERLYGIKWSSPNGRRGRGSFKFSKTEAEAIAARLNYDYPGVLHEIFEVPFSMPLDYRTPFTQGTPEGRSSSGNTGI